MGFTHFDKVSTTATSGGYSVGSATAGETEVIDESGHVTGSENIFLNAIAEGTTCAYIPIPFAMKLDAVYADIASGALGTGVVIALHANDTAGAALSTAITMGASAATAGSGLVTVGTLSTATLAALSTLVVEVTSATACTTQVTIVGHRV